MATQASGAEHSATAAMTPVKGLVTLAFVTVLIAGFIGISTALGIGVVFTGFLFLLYFTGMCGAAPEKFAAAAIGAFCGLAMAYLLATLPISFGAVGTALGIGMVLGAIYLLIMGWAPVFINNGTMLFLSIGAIPALQQPAMIVQMALSTALGVTLVGAGLAFGRWRARRG